ncbi:MAG: YopX family protein [Eubacteriales bacterium]|nr:YopX family protein [Eubacteriales bacterium]
MKREILFRGKSPKGHWIYGMPSYDLKYIFNDGNYDSYDQFEIIPETIGQFTGLTDKNGVKIFEGDVFKLGVEKEVFEVRFEHGCYMAFCNGKQYGLIGELQMCFINIIGNIHDNPELIK